MKNKVYVERYADRMANGDWLNAAKEIMDGFIAEFNSEVRRRHVRTDKERERLIGDMNRKGNELGEMMKAKTGRNIFKEDWFVEVERMCREREHD